MNPSIASLSSAQLRRAAVLKDKIQALEKELARLIGEAAPSRPVVSAKRRKGMSKTARALISAAQKARWAKLKAAKKVQK